MHAALRRVVAASRHRILIKVQHIEYRGGEVSSPAPRGAGGLARGLALPAPEDCDPDGDASNQTSFLVSVAPCPSRPSFPCAAVGVNACRLILVRTAS